jgi:hypothetical protein
LDHRKTSTDKTPTFGDIQRSISSSRTFIEVQTHGDQSVV